MKRIVLFSFLLVSLAVVGCGGRASQGVEVTGKVTLDNKPLQVGMVVFTTADGATSRMGELRPDGSYRVPEVPTGSVRVSVKTTPYAAMAKSSKGGKAVSMRPLEGQFVAVPRKYEDPKTSGLSYDVRKGESIEINLATR